MGSDSRYVLYKKVARGGMAEIYLGKQVGQDGFQRVCCIKRILPHHIDQAEYVKMFRDEAHIGKRLQHANIVRVEGFEELKDSYAIIMEFVNGGDLRALLSHCERQNVRLSIPMALFIIAEAARGLHYAHTKIDDLTGKPMGIIHRDISPQNILISFEGEVKVTDFGIADAQNKLTETKPGIVKGKYAYMSPEQITSGNVDARTDIFALTIVLWEMLAMKRLFQGESEFKTIEMVRSVHIDKDLRDLNPRVDRALYKIIQKGLSKKANHRYKDASEFEKSLRNYIHSKYSNFTVNDLSEFVKNILKERSEKMKVEIQKLLKMNITDQQSSRNTASSQQKATEEKKYAQQEASSDSLHSKFFSDSKSRKQSHISNKSKSSTSSRSKRSSVGASRTSRKGSMKKNSLNTKNRTSGLSYLLYKIRNFIIKTTLIGVIVSAGYGYYKYKDSFHFYYLKYIAGGVSTFALKTTPNRVKIKINNNSINNGRYLSTPIVIRNNEQKGLNNFFLFHNGSKKPINVNLKQKNNIIIYRKGFKKELIKFELTKSFNNQMILEPSNDLSPTRMRLKNNRIKSVWVEINDGEEARYLSYNRPWDLKYLSYGIYHTFKIYPLGPGVRKGSYTCKLKPNSRTWKAPFMIDIFPESKKCKISKK